MLFEVRGEDNEKILEAMKVFNQEAEAEYKTAIKKAEQIMKMMGKADVPLPQEFLMLAWEQDGRVYVRLPFPTPKVMKMFRRQNVMAKNIGLFLKERGLKCKVEYKNEQDEELICSKVM